MQHQTRTLEIATAPQFRKRLPLETCGQVFAGLTPLVEGALRLAIDGASGIQGRQPAWLGRATDIRFIDYGFEGDQTILTLEIPTLGEAASDLYRQQEMWDTRPTPDMTGIDVLSQVVAEVSFENGESPWFDPQLLKRFSKMRRVFGSTINSIGIKQTPNPSALNSKVVESAARLCASVPPSRQTRILGKLEMIRHSTRSFAVQLDSGQQVSGVLVSMEGVDSLASFFGKPVMVVGRAVYRPSGALLRIDADAVLDGRGESSVFSKLPPPLRRQQYTSRLRASEVKHSGVNGFFGTWPGDETDAELQNLVQELRQPLLTR